MFFQPHESAVCNWCRNQLWYGVKEEPSGWTVVYSCHDDDGCGREWTTGTINREDIKHIDEVYEKSRKMPPTGAQSFIREY